MKRALISVWDKTGLAEFAAALRAFGIELMCSGGTAAEIERAGIEVRPLSELTGFDDLLGGRVKTLHPSVYASILARPGDDMAEIEALGLEALDLIVVDLYPFAEAVENSSTTEDDPEVIEKIDIGGVCLLRAAAKNFVRTAVVHDKEGRRLVLDELHSLKGRLSMTTRRRLAASAMAATSAYDLKIADWLGRTETAPTTVPPPVIHWQWNRNRLLRYGENPHQSAALYLRQEGKNTGAYGAEQLQGRELSYNNLQDAQAAWEAVSVFDEPACVVVKHANPCAAALGESPENAWSRAILADRTSPFGGIVAFNRPVDATASRALLDFGFLEVVLAPAFDENALKAFAKKRNLRLLALPESSVAEADNWQWAGSGDALLVQQTDRGPMSVTADSVQTVTDRSVSQEQLEDLLFAWKIAAFVKSNAIVCSKDRAVTAVGAGQMSRVFSMQTAALKATLEGVELKGNVMASDAFFPFRDGIDRAAEQGIEAIIQPGGSVRDEEVIQAANEHGIAMVFTRMRHFRH